jgi:phage terminase small subunit
MKRLTKKQISEAIQSIPIERVLLGSNQLEQKLTPKQKRFAEEVVKTGNKTEAYRRAYNTNGKRETASRDAIKVSSHPHVDTYINALTLAKEAEEYLLPTRIRAMAIQKLTNMALDDELPPAQQLKALELVGKMSEVALFSERREIVHSLDSNTLKEKLMEAVSKAIENSRTIHARTKVTAKELLEELTCVDATYTEVDADDAHDVDDVDDCSGHGVSDGNPDTLRTPDTPELTVALPANLHSIPHNKLPEVGVSNFSTQEENVSRETPPVSDYNEKGVGGI